MPIDVLSLKLEQYEHALDEDGEIEPPHLHFIVPKDKARDVYHDYETDVNKIVAGRDYRLYFLKDNRNCQLRALYNVGKDVVLFKITETLRVLFHLRLDETYEVRVEEI